MTISCSAQPAGCLSGSVPAATHALAEDRDLCIRALLDDIGSNLVGAADIGIATIKVPVSPDELSVALDQLQSYTGVDLGSTLFSFNRLLLVMYFAMITFLYFGSNIKVTTSNC